MIEIQEQGDLLKADVEALVNTVNCVGVMGRGIALQFKKAFPENFRAYKAICDRDELTPGKVFIHDLQRLQNPRYIINFPTKRHWRGKSRLEDIEAGLVDLAEEIRELKITSVAVPPLGCGLGGLKWTVVRPLIERTFAAMPEVHVLFFAPRGAPAPRKMAKSEEAPKMTPGRAALIGLMRRYLAAVMAPHVTLLELHKLMYFMQESGERLRLNFSKAPYGPYAKNLRHVLNAIEGHFVSGYGDAEDNPDKRIELVPGAAERAEEYLAGHPDTRARFAQVADLIKGFESPYGLELLTTLHWLTRQSERVHFGAY